MTHRVAITAILVCWLASSGNALGNGAGESAAKPPARGPESKCARSCSANCNTPITVNCAPASKSDSREQDDTKPPPAPKGKGGEAGDPRPFLVQVFDNLVQLAGNVAWPLVVLFAIVYLGRDLISGLASRVRKLKGGPFEAEFSAERAREVAANVHESYKDFLKTAQAEYDRQANARLLQELLLPDAVNAIRRRLKEQRRAEGSEPLAEGYRATVHVPDVVFKDYLYQLLDYYPNGRGRGRRFSVRYGIVGQAWRLKENLGKGNALRAADAAVTGEPDREKDVRALISEWGMTRTEAENWERARPSFLCTLLRREGANGEPAGILYLDSASKNAFGNDSDATKLAGELQNDPAVKTLAEAVGKAMEELRKGGAFVEIV